MPKNAKNTPYKKREFELYLAWKSLPPIALGRPPEILAKSGFDNQIYGEVYMIKTQKEFAEKFGIKDLGTLTDWNKKIEDEKLLRKNHLTWARSLTSNILYAFGKRAEKEGRAAQVKLWLMYVENWVPPKAPRNNFPQLYSSERLQKIKRKLFETLNRP